MFAATKSIRGKPRRALPLPLDLSKVGPGFSNAAGVTISPDGQSLYFVTGINDSAYVETLVQTDLSGNFIRNQSISSSGIENIAVVTPQ
jgi:hypothetical protein